ncbi:TadE/TadG family type IV pilus assembly protein [Streptomyces boninensis]|uniref:TadE/TadG family type IV pilus assembly protein n=1 Tax=Streptomyces boninensis TaxID=2039455 RepID=UPI003B21CBBD
MAARTRRSLARLRDDRGTATVELIYVFPLLFTLILIIAQYAMWAHAAHTAQTTASHALSATRVQHADAADGHAEAQRVLDQLGRSSLENPAIEVHRDSEHAEVRISGTASAVIPFLHLPINAKAAGSVEKFRGDTGSRP